MIKDEKKTRTLLRFEVHVVDYCNLNCINCSHYSPLVKHSDENILNVDGYTKDCEKLSQLFDAEVEYIHLLGGEPLLHPEIEKIIYVTRKNFKYGRIELITNGVLLNKMSKSFWETCNRNRIDIRITVYPIQLNLDKILKCAKDNNVVINRYNGFIGKTKMRRNIIDLKGDNNPEKNFEMCKLGNICIQLRQGKLYTCPTAAYARYLQDNFSIDICESKRNYIDIYKCDNAEEILSKLAKPIPFCRYCCCKDWDEYSDEWQRSRRNYYEWVRFEFTERDIDNLYAYNRIFIYGAGVWAQKVVGYMKNVCHIGIDKIIVTNKTGNLDYVEGIEVISIDDTNDINEGDVCIIAVSGEGKNNIQELLYHKGFVNVIPIMTVNFS